MASLKLIKNTLIATPSGAAVGVDILIEGDRIARIAPEQVVSDAETIDGSGTLASPGFVDGHRHLWQTTLRGLLSDRVLADYYRRVRVGFSTVYTPDDVYLAIYAGAIDSLQDGVTCVLDHCHIMSSPAHADAAVSALKDSGIRGVLCYGFYDSPVRQPVFLSAADRHRDFARVRKHLVPHDDGRVTLGVALTEHWLVEPEVTSTEIRVARELGASRITLHVGSNPAITDLARYRATGCFGPDVTYSHCNSCQDEFFDFAKHTGAGIVATPETELGMGMGFPVTNKATERGIPFGLGADIVSFANGDMLVAARLALQTARMLHCLPSVSEGRMSESSGYAAAEALHWITAGGAAAIGLGHKTGDLKAGLKADIVLTSTKRLSMSPLPDAATALVMHASGRDVDTVIVDGDVRVLRGKVIGVDLDSLQARLSRSREGILSRMRQTNTSQASTTQVYESLIRGA